MGHHARILTCGGVSVFFIFQMVTGYCGAQMPARSGMQSSEEAQRFKAQQEQKMRDYMARFEKENREFMPTLANMGRNEKIEAVRAFISKQYRQNSDFRKNMYEEQRAFMQQRFQANPNVQPAIKERMLSRIDRDYEDMKDFHEGKFEEDMEFLDGLRKDASIDGQELNTRLQEFFKSQKADAQDFLESKQQQYSR